MKKKLIDMLRRDEGYTLVETLVALVLFTSVAIPLGVSVGTLLIDRRAERLQHAVLLAHAEIDATIASGTFAADRHLAGGKYLVRRQIERHEGYFDVCVSVSMASDSNRVLCSFNKSLMNVPK